jgi:hypothetical protein
MKINIKPKAEKTVQRNLRVPVSLNEQMNATTSLADELNVDYHATLLAAIEQFNTEFDLRLREMKAKGERPTSSGMESLPGAVSQEHSNNTNFGITAPSSNGSDADRA